MIKVSTTGMAVSLKTDLRFPESGQHGHGSRIIHSTKDIKNNIGGGPMSDIIKFNSDREIVTEQNGEIVRECNDLAEMTEEMLLDARKEIANTKTLSVPIAELALLGTGVASLIPALRKVTQTTTFNTQGLYQLANAGVGDTLKIAKNGNFWGAFKTADGSSKFAQLQAA